MSDGCDAADRLAGGRSDDGGRCHGHLCRTRARRQHREVGTVPATGHHEDRVSVGEEHQTVRDRRHGAPECGRGLRSRARGIRQHPDRGVDAGIDEVLLYESAAFGKWGAIAHRPTISKRTRQCRIGHRCPIRHCRVRFRRRRPPESLRHRPLRHLRARHRCARARDDRGTPSTRRPAPQPQRTDREPWR